MPSDPIPPKLVQARWAIALLFLSNGAMISGIVLNFPEIKRSLNLTDTALGSVLFLSPLGAMISGVQMGRVIARFGSKPVISAAAVALAFAVPFAVWAPTLPLFGLGLFLFGLTNAVLDASMNAQSVTIQHRYPKPMLSSTHGCWSLGGFLAAGAFSVAGAAGVHRLVLSIACTSALLLGCLLATSRLLPPSEDVKDDDEDVPTFALPHGPLLLVGILCILAFGAEGAGFDWAAIYLRDSMGAAAHVSKLAFGAFTGCMAVGRFAGDWVVAKIGHVRVVQFGSAICASGLLLAATAPNAPVAIGGFALAGLGLSNVVPILFQAAGSMPGISTGTGIAAVTSLGYSAFFFIPPAIGFISDTVSMSFAFVCIAAGTLFMAAQAERVLRRAHLQGPP